MTKTLIDPLFNNPYEAEKTVKISLNPPNFLVSAAEMPPISPTSKQPMQLVKGAFNGKEFSMWCDPSGRLTIPVRELDGR